MKTEPTGAVRTGILRGVLQILASRSGVLVLALAVQVLLARTLGPEGRGAYDAALLWGTLAIMLLNPGLETSSVYFISSGALRLRACIAGTSWLLILILLATVAGTATMIAVQPQALAGYLDKASGILLVLGATAGVTTLAVQTSLAMSTAEQHYGTYSSGQIVHRSLQFLGALLLILTLQMGSLGAVLAIIMADVLIVALVMRRLLRESHGTPLKATRPVVGAMLAYGRRFYVGKLGGQFNFRIGPLVLAASASVADLGLYGQASAVAIQYMSIPESIYTVLLPKMSSDTTAAARQTAQVARFMAILGMIAMGISLAIARPMFGMLFSEEFLPAVPVFQVLLAAFVIRALGKVHEPYLMAMNRPGIVSIAVALGLGVNVILLAVLYAPHGLTGVAWALLGNYAVSTAVLIGAYARLGKVRPRQYLLLQNEDLALIRSARAALVRSRQV